MDESDACTLLKTKLNPEPLLTDSKDLLIALDYIPLAITQAAAFISNGAPRMNVSRYLELFNENESSLLNKDAGDLRRDPEVPNAVIATWQVSFKQTPLSPLIYYHS
jgi:hypothetical protein